VVRARLKVPAVHTIGYCVAGTTLAATLAFLARRGEADKVASATFFTAQVDFEKAGDLKNFIDDQQLQLLESLATDGFLDGRYMAATFNMLRGRDLIWSYVVNNYLLGEEYPAFDLLHWNGDTTNLPFKWQKAYLTELYRDNRLVVPDRS
jgi:polyhydroxyalkanoate synthase